MENRISFKNMSYYCADFASVMHALGEHDDVIAIMKSNEGEFFGVSIKGKTVNEIEKFLKNETHLGLIAVDEMSERYE